MNNNNSDTELARISSFILTGLFALMSFLLVVGVQSLPNNIQKLMFASIALLSLNIVLFGIRNLLSGMAEKNSKKPKGARLMQNMRIGQHLLFVVSIGVVAWLGIAVSQFFYKPVNQQPAQGSSQQQPVEEQATPEEAPAPAQ